MAKHSTLGGHEPNIVPLRSLPRLFDPLFLEAHQLVDQLPRDRIVDLIRLLRRAVANDMAETSS